MPLESKDLVVGKTYRAKKPKKSNLFSDDLNDRTILWKGTTQVQFDGPEVKQGSKYPRLDIEKFLKWADKEVPSVD